MAPIITLGSARHRWDPHLHPPGILLSDQFAGKMENNLNRVEESFPIVEAPGVTDYFCLQTYGEVRNKKAAGRLPHV